MQGMYSLHISLGLQLYPTEAIKHALQATCRLVIVPRHCMVAFTAQAKQQYAEIHRFSNCTRGPCLTNVLLQGSQTLNPQCFVAFVAEWVSYCFPSSGIP